MHAMHGSHARHAQALEAGGGGGEEARLHVVDEHHPNGSVRCHVDRMRELPDALAQAEPDGWLAVSLEASHWQVQELPVLERLFILEPTPHRKHAQRNGDHCIHQVDCCDQEDQDVHLVDEVAAPYGLFAVGAGVFVTTTCEKPAEGRVFGRITAWIL